MPYMVPVRLQSLPITFTEIVAFCARKIVTSTTVKLERCNGKSKSCSNCRGREGSCRVQCAVPCAFIKVTRGNSDHTLPKSRLLQPGVRLGASNIVSMESNSSLLFDCVLVDLR